MCSAQLIMYRRPSRQIRLHRSGVQCGLLTGGAFLASLRDRRRFEFCPAARQRGTQDVPTAGCARCYPASILVQVHLVRHDDLWWITPRQHRQQWRRCSRVVLPMIFTSFGCRAARYSYRPRRMSHRSRALSRRRALIHTSHRTDNR
jgi:hypothetical protein